MIIHAESMQTEVRSRMRDGKGDIEIRHLAPKEHLVRSRLLADITIPVGGSIGEHEHRNETEYYLILTGEGSVIDDGQAAPVAAGDTVITGDGHSHSIVNTGDEPLRMIAVIILED